MRSALIVSLSAVLCLSSFTLRGQNAAQQQTPATPDSDASAAKSPTQTTAATADAVNSTSLDSKSSADSKVDTPAETPAKKTYTVPAGTKVLLQLRSSVNTKSAQAGDGVYLVSAFPVVVGNRVMIPAGVYVQGVVDRVQRAGRVKGKAQLDMHFSSIIFPNGTVVEIPGVVNALPGAKQQDVKKNDEGTIEQNSDKQRNAGKVAEVAIPTGGTIGSIGGLGSGHPLAGGLAGVAAGVATAGFVTLFTRGADVDIQSGTQVEMVLQRPLILEEENLAAVGGPGTAQALVPAGTQPKPLEKPRHTKIMCPPGSLGCE